MSTPFRLRILHGPDAGRYVVRADYKGVESTDDINIATRYSIRDAYGNVAAFIDRLRLCVAPENAGDATEDDYKTFAEIAAKDMFQFGGPEIQTIISDKCCRRSPNDSLVQPDFGPPTVTHMSVWEWVGRAAFGRMSNRKETVT